jgi:hypothetical protein
VETTLSVAKRSGKLIWVNSADIDTGSGMDIYTVRQQVVIVKIEKALDLTAAVV